jgi:hypothetical protein
MVATYTTLVLPLAVDTPGNLKYKFRTKHVAAESSNVTYVAFGSDELTPSAFGALNIGVNNENATVQLIKYEIGTSATAIASASAGDTLGVTIEWTLVFCDTTVSLFKEDSETATIEADFGLTTDIITLYSEAGTVEFVSAEKGSCVSSDEEEETGSADPPPKTTGNRLLWTIILVVSALVLAGGLGAIGYSTFAPQRITRA